MKTVRAVFRDWNDPVIAEHVGQFLSERIKSTRLYNLTTLCRQYGALNRRDFASYAKLAGFIVRRSENKYYIRRRKSGTAPIGMEHFGKRLDKPVSNLIETVRAMTEDRGSIPVADLLSAMDGATTKNDVILAARALGYSLGGVYRDRVQYCAGPSPLERVREALRKHGRLTLNDLQNLVTRRLTPPLLRMMGCVLVNDPTTGRTYVSLA